MRGALGRAASKRDLAMRREAGRLRRIVMAAGGIVAEDAVQDVLQQALRRTRRLLRLHNVDREREYLSVRPVLTLEFVAKYPRSQSQSEQNALACSCIITGDGARTIQSQFNRTISETTPVYVSDLRHT